MRKREIKRQHKRIQAIADKWLRPLGLLWWSVEFTYRYDRKHFRSKDGREAFAITYADWRYMRAVVEVNMKMLPNVSDEELEEYLLHEFMHILLDETGSGNHHEERVATTLANAFLWVREADK